MDTRLHRSRFLLAAPAFAIVTLLGGCGGGSATNSGGTEVQATPAPGAATASPAAYRRPHHHHRHPRSGNAAAAGGVGATNAAGATAAPGGGAWPCDDPQFLKDQRQFAGGALQGDQEVDVCGNVTKVLASEDTRSGLHGYYDVQVAPGDTIEIVCDLGEMDAPAWPWVKVGDYSYVQGRYYYDSASSQGIDWTHHGTSRSWGSPGYVVVAGTEYQ
jgi:hypothetical protein